MAATRNLPQSARLFHALSDETRLLLVDLLRPGERCVCELMEALDAGQSRLSFHLKTLKDAGVVSDRREGRWVYYTLRTEALEDAAETLAALKSAKPTWTRSGACCT